MVHLQARLQVNRGRLLRECCVNATKGDRQASPDVNSQGAYYSEVRYAKAYQKHKRIFGS